MKCEEQKEAPSSIVCYVEDDDDDDDYDDDGNAIMSGVVYPSHVDSLVAAAPRFRNWFVFEELAMLFMRLFVVFYDPMERRHTRHVGQLIRSMRFCGYYNS